jgi:hypothetical protein
MSVQIPGDVELGKVGEKQSGRGERGDEESSSRMSISVRKLGASIGFTIPMVGTRSGYSTRTRLYHILKANLIPENEVHALS